MLTIEYARVTAALSHKVRLHFCLTAPILLMLLVTSGFAADSSNTTPDPNPSTLAVSKETPPALPKPSLVHPYIGTSLNLNGGGYSAISQSLVGGINLEMKRLVFNANAKYDNAHKTNDGTLNNTEGHRRSLVGELFYRLPKRWYVGAGASWSQTSTTNYSVQAWFPRIGGGRDWVYEGFSCRAQGMYVSGMNDSRNGVSGVDAEIWFPSPVTRHHFFLVWNTASYRLHDTLTDPTNQSMTATQLTHKHFTTYVSWTFVIRY